MFDWDKWQEILYTIRKNALRTFLTMFGVSWALFMLIVLLGSGSGLRNGVISDFSAIASNAAFVWPQRTTMAYAGYKPGRYTSFDFADYEAIAQEVPEIGYLAPRNQLGGYRDANNVSRKNKSGAFSVMGDFPEIQHIIKVNIIDGRHLNDKDLTDKRKIAVIGDHVREVLFDENEQVVGNYLKIQGVYFKIVGIFKSLREDEDADRDESTIYIPLTTFQLAFNNGDRINYFAFTADPGVPASKVEAQVKEVLMRRHNIHPEDVAALGSNNIEERFKQFTGLFDGIDWFVWFVGVLTLAAGVIGVSNIMLIIVKERTQEIGIRKALGATPWSIMSLIMQESIFITTVAGYIGLFLSIALVEYVGNLVIAGDLELGVMGPPAMNLNTALLALVILVAGGALAGFIPARKAASIRPIEAIRTENG